MKDKMELKTVEINWKKIKYSLIPRFTMWKWFKNIIYVWLENNLEVWMFTSSRTWNNIWFWFIEKKKTIFDLLK